MTDQIFLLAQKLGSELLLNGIKITTAESCTGGGIASAITAIPGSSDWFEYGFVTYANVAKQQLLGIPSEMINAEGAVSGAVVTEMAMGALKKASADIAVAVSGIAGPDGGSTDKPVGTVWFAWVTQAGSCTTACQVFTGDRAQVRAAAVRYSLQGALDILKK